MCIRDRVNSDPYGEGWMFEMTMSDPGQLDELLDVDSYTATLS